MKVSLIITTYNWPEALNAVLRSVNNQVVLPDEVIIADDGSKDDTSNLINNWKKKLKIPLIHAWQEDDGFRLARSRNNAIAKSSGDIIIMIDGDMVLSKKFILSYKKSMKKGFFIQAGRVLTDLKRSEHIQATGELPNFFSSGIRNRKNTISNEFLSKIFSYTRNNSNGTRGCNMAFWRKDVFEINGFDNEFVGWGREDTEFTERMLNYGVNRLYLKFSGVAFHLYHEEKPRTSVPGNDERLQMTVLEKKSKCENGLDRFLVEKES